MRAGCGCFLILVAIVLLFALIVIPVIPLTAENRTVDDYLKALLCQPNERVIREQYSVTDFDGTGFSMTVFCQDAENQREDVTAKWTIYGIIAFLLPFLVGLLLLIVGLTRRAAKAVNLGGLVGTSGFGAAPQVFVTRYGDSASPVEGVEYEDGVLRVGGIQIATGGLSPEQAEAFRRQARSSQPASGDNTSLAAKLKQIQEAHDAGLISADEYERLRQEILDNMG